MSLRLLLLDHCLPGPIRRRMLRELIQVTADAFSAPRPPFPAGGNDAAISAFARFTRELVDGAGDAAVDAAAVQDRLYRGAREMGRMFRRIAAIRSPEDAARALRLLYRAIGIEVEVDLALGELTVRRCAFSNAYTPAVCRFISALDAGMVDGLTGGTTVVFTERITEGAARCRAAMVRGTTP